MSRSKPTTEQLERELARIKYKKRYARALRGTLYVLIVVAAVAVLVATLFLPVLRIYGSSMPPTLNDGDIVIVFKGTSYDRADVIAFYHNNKILVKRVIAFPGDWVDIDSDGTVYVNGKQLDEPYLDEKSLGECDIELPYQVPSDRLFVMGDHRSSSIDSRSSAIGCIKQDEILGKLVFRFWPLSDFGSI